MDTNHEVLKRVGGFEFWRDSTGAVFCEALDYHANKVQIDPLTVRMLVGAIRGPRTSPIAEKPSVSPKPTATAKWPYKLILTFAAGLLLGLWAMGGRKKS